MDIIRKPMTITIEYVTNAVRSPTWMVPRSTLPAPTHTISTDTPFMMNIITGIMMDMVRFVNSWVSYRSLLAFSNRFSSCASRLKARIGMMPVNSSLDTRFKRSTSVCIFLNFGMATASRIPISADSAITATTMIQLIPDLVRITFTMPNAARIGAYATIRSSMTITNWTCWISLVDLVIRDAVENFSISALVNFMTFS